MEEGRLPGIDHRRGAGGHWLPPRALGTNRLSPSLGCGRWYRYTHGHEPVPVPLPSGTHHYRTASLYYTRATIYLVPYDATQNQVGDGTPGPEQDEDTTSSDDTESESGRNYQDWRELGFHWQSNPPLLNSVSRATYDGPRQSMCLHHQGQQQWIRQLLPDRYRPTQPASPATHPPTGGLIGDLPILIGLIALSVHPDHVDDAVRYCMHGPSWRPYPHLRDLQREYLVSYPSRPFADPHVSGFERRGVVVQVHACYLPTTQTPSSSSSLTPQHESQISVRSDRDMIRAFERGAFGPIFA